MRTLALLLRRLAARLDPPQPGTVTVTYRGLDPDRVRMSHIDGSGEHVFDGRYDLDGVMARLREDQAIRDIVRVR